MMHTCSISEADKRVFALEALHLEIATWIWGCCCGRRERLAAARSLRRRRWCDGSDSAWEWFRTISQPRAITFTGTFGNDGERRDGNGHGLESRCLWENLSHGGA